MIRIWIVLGLMITLSHSALAADNTEAAQKNYLQKVMYESCVQKIGEKLPATSPKLAAYKQYCACTSEKMMSVQSAHDLMQIGRNGMDVRTQKLVNDSVQACILPLKKELAK